MTHPRNQATPFHSLTLSDPMSENDLVVVVDGCLETCSNTLQVTQPVGRMRIAC
jgi:hypothetical protein